MAPDLFDVETRDGAPAAIVLRVRVQPGAGRSAVTGRHGDALALRVAAPPVDGRANAQCVALVADLFGVRKSKVEISAGERSRMKRLRVLGVEPDRARERIAEELRVAGCRPGRREGAERLDRPRA